MCFALELQDEAVIAKAVDIQDHFEDQLERAGSDTGHS
jgi:hypothetical protein